MDEEKEHALLGCVIDGSKTKRYVLERDEMKAIFEGNYYPCAATLLQEWSRRIEEMVKRAILPDNDGRYDQPVMYDEVRLSTD